MENHVRLKALRPVLLVALVVAGAGIAAKVAGAESTASAIGTDAASQSPKESRLVRAKLNHGLLRVKGTQESEKLALRLQAGNAAILELDVGDDGSADFSFERGDVARIAVDARRGDDVVRVDDGNGRFTDGIQTELDGGFGADVVVGGAGAESLLGGDGDDVVDGNGGADTGVLGEGEDVFVWDPGDGSDVVEGQGGADTMLFNGAGGAEQVDLSANGSRLRFFRVQGAITMDTAGVERVDFNALGGVDFATVNDLSATEVTDVRVDLGGALGGAGGDGEEDGVVVNGTDGKDAIGVSGSAAGVNVSGLSALVAIQHHEPADRLAVNGLAGDDVIDSSGLAAGAISLTVDGGAGEDALAGGAGAESLFGGDGDDVVDGNGGADTGVLGGGEDVFVWDPGDGSDVVEGGEGADTMLFNGAAGAESFEVSANGGRLRFFRAQGAITMDVNETEVVEVQALGGADSVLVNDLGGTNLKQIGFDLEGAVGAGGGDGAADSLTLNGSERADDIQIGANGSAVEINGLAAAVQIDHAQPTDDTLTVNGLGGDDTFTTDRGITALIRLLIDGVPFPTAENRP